MTTDAWLAIIHHLAVFGIAAVLAAEWALVRPGLSAAEIRRLVRIDSAYGALAAVVLSAGLLGYSSEPSPPASTRAARRSG